MTARHAFTLLEVLLAAVLLAAVVVACLPLLRSTDGVDPAPIPDPSLASLVADASNPPDVAIERFDSMIGKETEGQWVIVRRGGGFAITWRAALAPHEGKP